MSVPCRYHRSGCPPQEHICWCVGLWSCAPLSPVFPPASSWTLPRPCRSGAHRSLKPEPWGSRGAQEENHRRDKMMLIKSDWGFEMLMNNQWLIAVKEVNHLSLLFEKDHNYAKFDHQNLTKLTRINTPDNTNLETTYNSWIKPT